MHLLYCPFSFFSPSFFSEKERKKNNNIIQKIVDYELHKESLSQVMRDFQIRMELVFKKNIRCFFPFFHFQHTYMTIAQIEEGLLKGYKELTLK